MNDLTAAINYSAHAITNAAAFSETSDAAFSESTSDEIEAAFWSAVSSDATLVDEGAAASDIAGSPLWPQGQPDQLRSLWQEVKATLLAAKQDWQVWTIWYDDRLAGRVRDEKRELTHVWIEESLWDQGPAVVNAEIKRLIEELEPPSRVVEASASVMAGGSSRASLSVAEPAISAVPVDNPPIGGAAAQHHSEVLAAWPHPGRQYVPDVLFNPVALAEAPPAPIEAVPEQEPLATRFGVNSQGLIDVVPDSPAPETAADALQREFYEETRLKAQALVALGSNQLGDLSGPANRFREGLKDRIEDISITSLWSRGNTLRSRLKAHDVSTSNEEPDPGRLAPLVAETLRDLVHTWNIFIVGDPKGRELDEIRLGPRDVEAAKQVVSAAAPLVEALQHSENVATPVAIQAVAEQAEAAKNAPAGIDGDQAISLSRRTSGNFVSELLRRVIQGESAFAWKEYRAGIYRAAGTATAGGIGYAAYNNWPAIVSFVAKNADALKEFVTTAWHNPTLVEIIDWVVRTST
jgi:8-oxo-dGTP pyrophosphatase MutT (NUDIX family)